MTLAGLVFTSGGFVVGSTGYSLLTATTVLIVVTTTCAFAALLLFEVYRSLRLSLVYNLARERELDAVERSLRRGRPARARSQSLAKAIHRRRSSVVKFVRSLVSGGNGGGVTSPERGDGGRHDGGGGSTVTATRPRRRSSIRTALRRLRSQMARGAAGDSEQLVTPMCGSG